MRISTAAVALNVTPRRVRQLVADGRLPGTVRLGPKVLHVPSRAVFDHLRAAGPATSAAVA